MSEVSTEHSAVESLRQEHEELVGLFIHEDSMAWQLTIGLLAANAVVVAGAHGLGLFDPTKSPQIDLFGLLLLGSAINVVGFFVLQRSKLHRTSRLFRAYHIEAALGSVGVALQTFSSAEGNIFRNTTLRPDGVSTRPLRWWERIEALDLHFFYIVAGALLLVTLWLFFGRAGLRVDALRSNIGLQPTAAGELSGRRG